MDDGSAARARARARIDEAAASLVVRRACAADPSIDTDIAAWAGSSAAHAVALARAEAAWDAAERLRACPPPIAPEAVAGPAGRVEAWFSRQRVGGALAAASLVAVLATIAIEKLTAVDRYGTEVGEQRTVTLADGSRVRLNTSTTIEVAIDHGERRVDVLGGEALFDVAPDPHRPFVVRAGGSVVRALGTGFNLRLRSELVELTVTRGSVAVRDGGSSAQRVAAGDSAAIRDGLVVRTPLDGVALRRRVRWASGLIDLTGASLGQAVEEINRYRKRPVVIGDPRLAILGVGGAFPTSRSDLFLEQVEQRLPVRAITVADGSVLLVQRSGDQQG